MGWILVKFRIARSIRGRSGNTIQIDPYQRSANGLEQGYLKVCAIIYCTIFHGCGNAKSVSPLTNIPINNLHKYLIPEDRLSFKSGVTCKQLAKVLEMIYCKRKNTGDDLNYILNIQSFQRSFK